MADNLKLQGIGLGIASGAAIPAFEIFTGGKGIISMLAGGGTLGYGIYKYYKDSQVVNKQRNFGDTVADFLDIGIGTVQGAAFGISHIYMVGALAAGGIVLYLLSGMVSVQPTTISASSVPSIIGAIMGISGGVILYLDGEAVESVAHPDAAHTIAHEVVNQATEGLSNDIKNMKAATTASGWENFAHNFTHPGEYFPEYGQTVKTAWNNIHDVGSFWNAWTTTFSIVGDMFSIRKTEDDAPPPIPPARYYDSGTFSDYAATGHYDQSQLDTSYQYYNFFLPDHPRASS